MHGADFLACVLCVEPFGHGADFLVYVLCVEPFGHGGDLLVCVLCIRAICTWSRFLSMCTVC